MLAEHKAPVYPKSGLTLITSKMRRPPPEILDPQIHHANLLNSILAKIEANKAGADDAIMLDLRGFVAETNATHLFLVARRGGDEPCRGLPGRNHARHGSGDLCRGENPMRGSDLKADDNYAADEVFCTGTMGELAAVTKIDDRTIGDGSVGPMTKRLSELYAQAHRHLKACQVVD